VLPKERFPEVPKVLLLEKALVEQAIEAVTLEEHQEVPEGNKDSF
jgi:hypothetical protein